MHSKEFEEIYSTYSQDVYKFLLHLCGDGQLAEDILQDTFLKAIENIDSFDGRCKLSSWLCQIAKNLYFDHLRKMKNKSYVDLDTVDAPDPDTSHLDKLILKETGAKVLGIVHQLPEPYKEVFMLRVYGEMAYKDIAALFGKNDTWARVIFLRGKKMVLEQYGEEER